MAFSDNTLPETKQRIVQELVPGKRFSGSYYSESG